MILVVLKRVFLFSALCLSCSGETHFRVGAAKVDITPNYLIRLSGFGSRTNESQGIAQHIWAKAIAIQQDEKEIAVFAMVDNCGISKEIRDEVADTLLKEKGIPNERLVIYSTHTHCAPCLRGVLPNIFSSKIIPEEQATIDRYTAELVANLKKACVEAASDLQPGELFWGEGLVDFASNRRTPGGPTDHAMPMLVARGQNGKPRAILVNYACHCTTLSINSVHGDWAGYAQENIERDNPGAVAMVSIGCGADSNPMPRGQLKNAEDYGSAIAAETASLLDLPLTKITEPLQCLAKVIQLPFDPLPTKEQWEERGKQSGIVGYHARVNLDRLVRGEELPTTLPYPVSAWNFGNQLAMVFLAGEVVVDYSLRLKKEFDRERLWVNGYANYVPCYIPSVRILEEGGYEAETSLWYYDRPARLSTKTEELIISAVHDLVPSEFAADEHKLEFPPAKTPEQSLLSIRTRPELKIQLVAAEPLVESPVAIDWGADGKLWVVEMRDFPMGIDGNWKPGGRVKFLEDTNADGIYDKATVFLDELPFPTGVTAYRDGVLVCAAPDIIYARDMNGDGKPDEVRKLFSGFATDNYQARVNSLSLGLDNWIYGANGLIGGTISGGAIKTPININGRDFRLNVETGDFETASGITQQGRVRDHWGNWYGCDNSNLIWEYPLPEHYLRRNPGIAAPSPRVSLPADDDPNKLFPVSHTLKRFNDVESANRTTSACGLGIYRDSFLGEQFYGNAFVCEPVHNLVHRMVLREEGLTHKAWRASDEQQREFLAARDNWFRPVQARTGPDGALWIVDMYRFVVEHPRWITKERLASLNLRAGADKGRIYRLFPRAKQPRPIRDLRQLKPEDLARAIDDSNGTERDRIQLELLSRNNDASVPVLEGIAQTSDNPPARIQALSTLQGITRLKPEIVLSSLNDSNAHVRRFALELSDPFVSKNQEIASKVASLARDPDPRVRFQAAFTLGQLKDQRAAQALADLAQSNSSDPYMSAAVLSSSSGMALDILSRLQPETRSTLAPDLISTALNNSKTVTHAAVEELLLPSPGTAPELWQLAGYKRLLDQENARPSAESKQIFSSARRITTDTNSSPELRAAAIRLLGREPEKRAEDLALLRQTLISAPDPSVVSATLTTLAQVAGKDYPQTLIADWLSLTPATRRSVLHSLLQKDSWTDALLTHVGKEIAPSEFGTVERQRLLTHKNSSIKSRAQELFPSNSNTSRGEVLKQFANAVEMPGNPAHGSEIFARTCATCHAFKGQGFAVGPDLAALTDRSGNFLLNAIIDPNAAVESRYLAYNVETKDGRSLLGLIADESANSLTVVNAGGVRETLLRSNIQEIRASNLSLMPEGLEQGMSTRDFANLIAFLQQGPAILGNASSSQTALARNEWSALSAGQSYNIKTSSESLPYTSWLGTLPLHVARQTTGNSVLSWEATTTREEADGKLHFRFPAAMGFISQPSGRFNLAVNGAPALEFDAVRSDTAWQSPNGSIRMVYTVRENNQEDSDGVLEIILPKETASADKPITFSVRGSASNSQRWFGVYVLPTRTAKK